MILVLGPRGPDLRSFAAELAEQGLNLHTTGGPLRALRISSI